MRIPASRRGSESFAFVRRRWGKLLCRRRRICCKLLFRYPSSFCKLKSHVRCTRCIFFGHSHCSCCTVCCRVWSPVQSHCHDSGSPGVCNVLYRYRCMSNIVLSLCHRNLSSILCLFRCNSSKLLCRRRRICCKLLFRCPSRCGRCRFVRCFQLHACVLRRSASMVRR